MFKKGDVVFYDSGGGQEGIVTAPGYFTIVGIYQVDNYIITEYNQQDPNNYYKWYASGEYMELAYWIDSPLYKALTKDVG